MSEANSQKEVSADYFKLFEAPIIRGGTFSREEDLPDGEKVVVISFGLWERRFARDPNMIGKTISLSGEPHVVIGIVGPSFDIREFGPAPDVWTASTRSEHNSSGPLFSGSGTIAAGRQAGTSRS